MVRWGQLHDVIAWDGVRHKLLPGVGFPNAVMFKLTLHGNSLRSQRDLLSGLARRCSYKHEVAQTEDDLLSVRRDKDDRNPRNAPTASQNNLITIPRRNRR